MRYLSCAKCATLFLISVAVLIAAADKKLPVDETSNEMLDISVSQPLTKDDLRQELGGDLMDDDVVAIRVTARPVSDKPVQLSLDEFLMVSTKDGQRSQPFEPGQLAGADSLNVTPNMRRGLGDHGARPSIGFGGIGIGSGGATNAQTPPVKVQESRAEKENPLLAVLQAKTLPEKQITEPITGLLFFQITGKFKPKDLELRFKGPGGPMALRFRDK